MSRWATVARPYTSGNIPRDERPTAQEPVGRREETAGRDTHETSQASYSNGPNSPSRTCSL